MRRWLRRHGGVGKDRAGALNVPDHSMDQMVCDVATVMPICKLLVRLIIRSDT